MQYFHLDIYVDPLPPACLGRRLMILETYTTKPFGDPEPELPPFLTIDQVPDSIALLTVSDLIIVFGRIIGITKRNYSNYYPKMH